MERGEKKSSHVCVQHVTLGIGQICAGDAGFLGQEGYFWLTRIGSDVTSASSSSGLGSSLASEILLSFPVVLGEVEEAWSQQTSRGGRAGRVVVVSVASLPYNTMVFLQMTDAV